MTFVATPSTLGIAMTDKDINYEVLPAGMAMDETDVNLRSYFSRMSDEKPSPVRPAVDRRRSDRLGWQLPQ